jgi:hypothetical protein
MVRESDYFHDMDGSIALSGGAGPTPQRIRICGEVEGRRSLECSPTSVRSVMVRLIALWRCGGLRMRKAGGASRSRSALNSISSGKFAELLRYLIKALGIRGTGGVVTTCLSAFIEHR